MLFKNLWSWPEHMFKFDQFLCFTIFRNNHLKESDTSDRYLKSLIFQASQPHSSNKAHIFCRNCLRFQPRSTVSHLSNCSTYLIASDWRHRAIRSCNNGHRRMIEFHRQSPKLVTSDLPELFLICLHRLIPSVAEGLACARQYI